MAILATGLEVAKAKDPAEKFDIELVFLNSVATGCHASDLVAPDASWNMLFGCGDET